MLREISGEITPERMKRCAFLYPEMNRTFVCVCVCVCVLVLGGLGLWFLFCLPPDGSGEEASGSFLMGETDCGGNWVLF